MLNPTVVVGALVLLTLGVVGWTRRAIPAEVVIRNDQEDATYRQRTVQYTFLGIALTSVGVVATLFCLRQEENRFSTRK
jgi:hypothetical protein